MECCEGGAICDIMRTIRSPLNEAQAMEVVTHILLALYHIHKNQILHRVSSVATLTEFGSNTDSLSHFLPPFLSSSLPHHTVSHHMPQIDPYPDQIYIS